MGSQFDVKVEPFHIRQATRGNLYSPTLPQKYS